MSARRGIILALVALAAILAWLRSGHEKIDSAPTARTPAAQASSTAAPPATGPRIAATAPAEVSLLADRLNDPAGTVQADLRIVLEIVEAYRTNFHENPVGTNAEITAALTGGNPLRLMLIPPGHPALNADGELCDRWSRAFFFHQLSGTQMEIRSGGPDRRMWTEDDAATP